MLVQPSLEPTVFKLTTIEIAESRGPEDEEDEEVRYRT